VGTGTDAAGGATGEGMLAGIRVVDLAGEPAAIAGRVLADLGADVVLIEPPQGVPLRDLPHTFAAWGAGKRSVVVESADDPRLDALLADADLVIEAIAEIPEAKHALFAELAGITRPDALLATNTSAISVTGIAEASGRAERVVGLHFFNPAPLMPLVEVVRTALVDDDAYAAALAFAEGLGKVAVACPDTPGFIVNRVLVPMLNDAVRALVETGVDPADLDRALVAGAGWPMGPLALIDLIGVDVQVHASEALAEGLGDNAFAPHPLLLQMLRDGRLGRKAGGGFHAYGS